MPQIARDVNASWIRLRPTGPTLLVVGVLAGLLWPQLADCARPLMSPTIFIFTLGTFLRVDGREFRAVLRRPRVSVGLPLIALVACPLLMLAVSRVLQFGAELSLAMVLSVAAPPSSGTAAVARMLGLSATIPFAVTLLSVVIAPLSLTFIALWFADVGLDPLALAARLAMMVGGAGAVALVLRRSAAAHVSSHQGSIDGLVLAALLVFAVATMAGVRQQLVEQPMTALFYVGVAFATNVGLQCLGAASVPGTLAERLTIGLVLGNRNVGLVWSAMGASVSPRMALFFAASQFPIYILPRLMDIFMRRTRKEKP
jgi:bile acid:Na+ symporter, BASS family